MKVYLGIGSNLEDREGNLREAITRINERVGKITGTSSIYETEPWGFQSDKMFLNMAVASETSLKPHDMLAIIQNIETRMGRVRGENQYTSRIIDIDILLYDDKVVNSSDLKIPHPLMQERKFVLVPLAEIAPDLVHPVFNETISELLAGCSDTSEVHQISPLSAKL